MKKNVLFFFFVILFPLVAYSSGNDAVANPAAVVEEGDVRFTVLTPRVIRMEWDSLHRFTDERSFIVINRNLPVPEFKKIIKGGKLTIRTDELELTYKLNTGKFSKKNLEIKYLNKKRAFTWNPSVTQKQNLKGTARTLDRMEVRPLLRGTNRGTSYSWRTVFCLVTVGLLSTIRPVCCSIIAIFRG